jgi:hypothetical protein
MLQNIAQEFAVLYFLLPFLKFEHQVSNMTTQGFSPLNDNKMNVGV